MKIQGSSPIRSASLYRVDSNKARAKGFLNGTQLDQSFETKLDSVAQSYPNSRSQQEYPNATKVNISTFKHLHQCKY